MCIPGHVGILGLHMAGEERNCQAGGQRGGRARALRQQAYRAPLPARALRKNRAAALQRTNRIHVAAGGDLRAAVAGGGILTCPLPPFCQRKTDSKSYRSANGAFFLLPLPCLGMLMSGISALPVRSLRSLPLATCLQAPSGGILDRADGVAVTLFTVGAGRWLKRPDEPGGRMALGRQATAAFERKWRMAVAARYQSNHRAAMWWQQRRRQTA